MSNQNAVTTQPRNAAVVAKRDLKAELTGDAFRRAVAQVLPKHLTADRFVRVAIMAMTRTPKLAECDKASFFGALMSLSQYGLEPDGRRAHLIPFKNEKRGCYEVQLIIDWKGLAELAMRSGVVSYLHADVISDGDLFDYNAGQIIAHVPWFLRRDAEKPAAPGDVFAAYALAKFKDGSSKAEVLSLAEVEAIRDGSQGYKMFQKGIAKSSPWDSHFFEMAKKTAFRRLTKWLPLSPEFRDAVELDDKVDPVVDVDAAPLSADFQVQLAAPEIESGEGSDEIPGAEAPPRNSTQETATEAGNVTAAPQGEGSAAPAGATTQAATVPPAPNPRVATIRKQLSRAGLTEGDAVTQIHKMFPNTEGCNSLDDVQEIAPNVINALMRGWESFVNATRKSKGVEAPQQ
ncbi:MAG: hypothetical protein E6Q97_14990 [Desulfurellales bacterium]|nr:MAG: hypothetical protein E6Q97_14990 [Desulfurellales bacterium]